MARIALLFSGLPRQWTHCVQSHLGLFQQHQVDVFFHFWDTIEDREKSDLLTQYRPAAYAFEKQVDFTAHEREITHTDSINSPARLMSQYYSWKRVAEIFAAHQEQQQVCYDFAVRLRADLLFFRSLDAAVPRLEADNLLLSNYNDFGIVNDMFAFGGIRPILYYHSLYDHLMVYKDKVAFNPERLLKYHLEQNDLGVKLLLTPLQMLVFRPHMVGMPVAECLQEHPGMNKWRDPEILADHEDFHVRKQGEEGAKYVDSFKEQSLESLQIWKSKQVNQYGAADGQQGGAKGAYVNLTQQHEVWGNSYPNAA